MPTAFDALARNGSSGSSSTSSEEDEINQDHRGGHQKGVASSCFYEDLTTQRADEETVLDAVYGDDFSKEDGVWGCPILSVHVRPSDIEEKRIGTKLTLKVQLVKKYPSVSPSIELSNVKGLNAKEQRNLLKMLKNKCRSLAASSVVMVCELVLIVEDFLFSHNKDPTLSSWDLMNAREEEKKKVAQEAERRLDFMREDGSPSALRDSVYDQQHSSNNNIDKIEKEKIEREYARQMEALKADEEDRRKRLMSQDYSDGGSDTNDISFDGEDDDDDFEFNESYDDNNASSSSRYKSDFIELGHLGKGGGGEVVKARNRLDRRTYAVKKVVLQLERGNFEKSGKLENAKLKREVTTISRMTHKNIVRYYQAWVEGGGKYEERNSHGDSGGSESQERKIESCASEKSSESSSEESESSRSNQGFWTSNFSDESVDSSSSWSDEDEHTAATPQNCDDADFHNNFSPLLAGLGLGNPDSDLMKRYQKSRTNESSNIFGESDSEMDPSQINDGSRSILYIQMEYCSTTLRRLIDDTSLQKMEKGEVWKLVRQMLEALVYIHKRKVIHRDLKPGNVFLDAGNNIRLGDFGLATTRKSSRLDDTLEDTSLQLDDISHLIGDPLHSTTSNKSNIADDTITGGVGTRFYCAPEQEGRNLNVTKGRPSYDTKADIFSLGIVLFEMFHPPFSTMMHRAETLEQLRASSGCYSTLMNDIPKGNILDNDLWKEHAKVRFPEAFRVTFCPENAQKLILWCLQHDATKRPSAEDILKSDLIPQLENRNEVLKAMFDRQTVSMSNEIDITWDTDAAAKVREHFPMSGKNSLMNSLLDNLREFASFSGKDKYGLQSSAMNCVAMMAANTALKRASLAGKIRGAPHYTASILAMAAATTSASTGHADGFLPRLTDSICNQLTKIFQSHGAVELKPPLLRPKGRIENGKDGHVEVMNERGIILLLPEDLTANFARSIGRAGGIGVKRYDIDKTFHKSKVGGHPRESLEASFDIVLEGANAHSNIFEAEVILVICQVMRNFVNHLPSVTFSQASTPKSNPFWFLRLTHTRLADAILDVCDVPTKESTRRACLHILTRCSAPPPSLVLSGDQTENLAKSKFKKQNSSEDNRSTPEEILDNLLEKAVQEQGLTKVASENLRTFLTNGCLPLPSDVTEALKNLQEATKKVRLTNDTSKRSKRYFDIARGIKAIQNLINMMNEMGISPSNHGCQLDGTRFLPPVYISLDLGLRQRQKHFQGNLYFQALLLPDNCKEEPSLFDENNTLLSGNPKTAIKIAEGGHYEELVRKFRPPGNFGSIQLDKYTSAPIPMCVGTRIFVRRLAERAYFEASFTARMESHTTRGSLSNTGTESIRRSLGHPLAVYSCVQCMIVGMNGFDSETLQTRAAVAARLWSEGISAEYVPQSGVMTSLLKHTSTPNFMSETSDWTVDQIGGICGLLKIPFLVIVQDHLLRDKGCVRLRIVQDSHPNISPIEYVRLSVLASVMKDHLQRKENSFQSTENNVLPDRSKIQTTNQDVTGSKSTSVDVECIFIDSDQFYLDVDNLSGRDPKSKSIKKIVRTSTQRVESYLENLCSASTHGEGCTVLAVKIPFMVLREFDSAAMFGDGPTVVISVSEILSKYPKHRKALKTLAMCLDHLLRRQHESSSADMNGKSKSTETKKSSEFFSALVYSIQDDRFDLLTLSHTSNSLESASHHEGSSGTPSTKSRRERNRR